MNTTNTSLRTAVALGIAALAALAASHAQAQLTDSGWYTGGNLGTTRATIDDARIQSGLLAGGYATTSIVDDERSAGFKLYGGYRMNRYFALEGGYFRLGDFGYTATTVPPGTLTGNMKVQGLNLDLVGILPLGERFEVFGRVGAAYAQTRDRFTGTGAVVVTNANPRKSDTNLKVGLGMGYRFSDNLGVRIEAERYRVNDAVGNKGDVDMLSVGLVYHFGAKPQAVMPRSAVYVPPPAPAPMPPPVVAAAPPPPPPAPAPAPPPPPMRVSFAADSLFDFDKSVVKPAGRQSLDRFGQDLRGMRYDSVSVTGHTDRIGSKDYNLKLSTRRAEAVSAYLVEAAAVPAAKITARGVNGANPVTKPGDCPGNRVTPALIACLQPDRRVEVEVTGTK